MMLHTLKWQGAHQVSFWPITPRENNELRDFHRNFLVGLLFGLECLVATLFPSIIYCLTFSYILCPHLRFASQAPESREETTIEMWAGKKRAPMPFIQGTKNMEFSCSLQHLLKATHKRRSKGVRMSRILNKNTCTKGELFMTYDVIYSKKNPNRKRIIGWCHASQP